MHELQSKVVHGAAYQPYILTVHCPWTLILGDVQTCDIIHDSARVLGPEPYSLVAQVPDVAEFARQHGMQRSFALKRLVESGVRTIERRLPPFRRANGTFNQHPCPRNIRSCSDCSRSAQQPRVVLEKMLMAGYRE